jgi:hypothetical protein
MEILLPLSQNVRPLINYRNRNEGNAWYPADEPLVAPTFFNGYVDKTTGARHNQNAFAAAAVPAGFAAQRTAYEQAVLAGDQNAQDAALAAIEAFSDIMDEGYTWRTLDVQNARPRGQTLQHFVTQVALYSANGFTLHDGQTVVPVYSEAHHADEVAFRQAALQAAVGGTAQAQTNVDNAAAALVAAITNFGAGSPQVQAAQATLDGLITLLTQQQTAEAAARASYDTVDDDFIDGGPEDWMSLSDDFFGTLDLSISAAAFAGDIVNRNISTSRMASVPMFLHLGQTDNIRNFYETLGFDVTNPDSYNEIRLNATRGYGRDPHNRGKMQEVGAQAYQYGAGVRTCIFQLWSDVKYAGDDAAGDPSYSMRAPVVSLARLDHVKVDKGAPATRPVIVLGIDQPQNGPNRYTAWEEMAFVGNNGFAKMAPYDPANQDPLDSVLDRDEGVLNPDIRVVAPHLLSTHNNIAGSNDMGTPVRDDVMYLVDCSLNFDEGRYIILRFNDLQLENTANRDYPSVAVFNTKDCSPELWMGDGYSDVHVVTRVENVRYVHRANEDTSPLNGAPLYPSELAPLDDHFWPRALGFDVPVGADTVPANAQSIAEYASFLDRTGPGAADVSNAENVSFLYMPSEYQDVFWTNAFLGRINASNAVGAVFQSKVRVSQHLCAPVLNPNRRIGCSAPLNYDSQHLPPELRDFRLELRDVKWDFLPGTKTLENLVMYEFNGGNQKQEVDESLLHLPQFRQFDTSTAVDGTFTLEVFSPYGMPSYIAMYARDADFSRDAERQPLIKDLSIRSNTTMKKSNSILEAREHELYHMTQRNVHPRAEYDRHRYRHRQVVLLSAEDIGMLGISEYQSQKRARYIVSGIVDRTATVTALFIYNNRGLLVHGREISVVRV